MTEPRTIDFILALPDSAQYEIALEEIKEDTYEFLAQLLKDLPYNNPPTMKKWDWPCPYMGPGGLSLLFFRLHLLNPSMQVSGKTASEWASLYLETALAQQDGRVVSKDRQQALDQAGCIGFMLTDVGMWSQAVVFKTTLAKDSVGAAASLNILLKKVDLPNKAGQDEFMYGNTGYLYALKFIEKYADLSSESIEAIRKVRSRVVERILAHGEENVIALKPFNLSSPPQLNWNWFGRHYIGPGHGMLGIATMLLSHDLTDEQRAKVLSVIDFCLSTRTPTGDYPKILESEASDLVQYCHGAPGIGITLLHLLKTEKDEARRKRYMEIIHEVNEITMSRGLIRKGINLCHGLAGNAYVFLLTARSPAFDKTVRQTAYARMLAVAKLCLNWKELTDKGDLKKQDDNASLYAGNAGAALFWVELLYGKDDTDDGFPCFTDVL